MNPSNAENRSPNVSSALVLREMEQAILSGYFKPRERLIEKDLLARFNVSRTVIREVLKMLEAKGLVKTTPFRGAIVVDLTREDVEQLYFLREQLENIAAHLVVKNISRKEMQRLNRLCKELEKHLRERTDQMIEKDKEFHRALFEPSGNSYLNDMIDYLNTKAHIVRLNGWSLPNRLEQSIVEHRAMIDALRQRDEKAFERLVTDHLLFSKNSYLAQLRSVKVVGESKRSKVSGIGR